MSGSNIKLEDDGSILLDGQEVGYLGWNENVLVDISVESQYQNQGIATKAVSQMIEKMERKGYMKVKTTTVVSPAMESVLRKVGFESKVEKSPIYDEDELDVDASDVEIPVEEEIVWEYYI
jgi:GNAT superfamily N-acetyltransferase